MPIFGRFFVKGRCATCKTPIPWRYFVLELVFSVFWGIILYYYHSLGIVSIWFHYPLLLLTALMSALLMYEDLKNFSVPVSWFAVWAVSIIAFLLSIGHVNWFLFPDVAILLSVIIVSLLVVISIKKLPIATFSDLFGLADVLALSLFTLFFGYMKVTLLLPVLLVLALLYLILRRKLSKSEKIPLLTLLLPLFYVALV
jgi:leader peptidase (prepilin peptidase)/N-methyltransferase